MSVIDDYLDKFEPTIRNELERIRAIAQSEIPDYEEAISYGMPKINNWI
jgi:uncharacterized protein YdhG (YjbR/CyaY superfamily)